MLITIGAFLAILIVLILAHEIGHFVTARAMGVRVEEFGLGFPPPRLLAIKRGETTYSINGIFLGGFVKMAGEEDPKIPGSLASKSIGARLLVLSSGSIMNLLLPLLLFSIAFMVPHRTLTEPVMVKNIAPNSPAARAGIIAGDTILEVNNRPINNISDLHRYVQLNLGNRITVLVKHPDTTVAAVTVVPRWQPPSGQGAVGIEFDVAAAQAGRVVTTRTEPFWRAIPMGVTEGYETFMLFKNGIVSMFIGTAPVALMGPVGVAQITGEVAKAGISPLLEFAAFFSINLGIINIFPLPALDGGRIAFVVLEWLRRGKRTSPKTEGMIHLIGFMLLLTLILFITYQDVIRIISGESLLP